MSAVVSRREDGAVYFHSARGRPRPSKGGKGRSDSRGGRISRRHQDRRVFFHIDGVRIDDEKERPLLVKKAAAAATAGARRSEMGDRAGRPNTKSDGDEGREAPPAVLIKKSCVHVRWPGGGRSGPRSTRRLNPRDPSLRISLRIRAVLVFHISIAAGRPKFYPELKPDRSSSSRPAGPSHYLSPIFLQNSTHAIIKYKHAYLMETHENISAGKIFQKFKI